MNRLILDEVVAYTIYSSDNEKQASAKGTYKNFSIASAKAVGAGWYGSDGVVKTLDNIFQDERGELYSVKKIGKYTDIEEDIKIKTIENIKSKLTKEELEFLGIIDNLTKY